MIYAVITKSYRYVSYEIKQILINTMYLNCNFNDFKFDVHLTMILFDLKTRVTPNNPPCYIKIHGMKRFQVIHTAIQHT